MFTGRSFYPSKRFQWPPEDIDYGDRYPVRWEEEPRNNHWRARRPPCGFGATLLCLILAILLVLAGFIATLIVTMNASGAGLMNECAEGNFSCPVGGRCIDTVDSYYCECVAGFNTVDDDCEDIDECETIDCDPYQCINVPGSYSCGCRKGYRRSAAGCQPIDECSEQTARCPYGAACKDTAEGYDCECDPGYQHNRLEIICEDIDECAGGYPNGCRPGGAACTNSAGSYQCVCSAGYAWNDDQKTCLDTDECESSPCPQNCTNTAGSYICSCGDGYDLIGGECVKFTVVPVGATDVTLTASQTSVTFECKVEINVKMQVQNGKGDPEVPSLGWSDTEGYDIPNERVERHSRYKIIPPYATDLTEQEWISKLTINNINPAEDRGVYKCKVYHNNKMDWVVEYTVRQDP